jgi:hypothetical protein
MRQLAKTLLLGCVACVGAVTTSSQAWAQGEIRGVRTSTNPQFDRLVFDLGPNPVDASAVRGDRYLVEFQASPPSLDFGTEDKLSALGVKIERGGAGTRVAIDRRGREVRVFKLGGGSGSSGRVVLDIAKAGTSSLPIPADAGRIPERTDTASGGAVPVLGGSSAAPRSGSVPVLGGGDSPAPRSGGVPVLGGDPPRAASNSGSGSGVPVLGGELPKVSLGGGTTAPRGNAAPSRAGGGGEEVWVSVRAIDFEGVAGEAPSRDDLLNLELNVSVSDNGDLVAPRTDLPVQTVTLRGLTSDDRRQSRIGGSLLQQIVERIADEYEERGKYGTRIDISKRDLERLINDQDGRLVIKISEASEAGSGVSG